MLRAILASVAALALSACFASETSIYDAKMGLKPWNVAQERQADIAQLTLDEQKLIGTMVARARISHEATGYPKPDSTFADVLRSEYGPQFRTVLEAKARAEKAASEAKAAE